MGPRVASSRHLRVRGGLVDGEGFGLSWKRVCGARRPELQIQVQGESLSIAPTLLFHPLGGGAEEVTEASRCGTLLRESTRPRVRPLDGSRRSAGRTR